MQPEESVRTLIVTLYAFYFILYSFLHFQAQLGCIAFNFPGSHPPVAPIMPRSLNANQNPSKVQRGHGITHIVSSYCLCIAINK